MNPFEIHVIFKNPLEVNSKPDASTGQLLAQILQNQKTIMATLADLQKAVADEDSVIDSAVTLIKGLADQIAALAPNQAAIDALAADVKAKSDSLAAAVTANTPAPPASA